MGNSFESLFSINSDQHLVMPRRSFGHCWLHVPSYAQSYNNAVISLLPSDRELQIPYTKSRRYRPARS